MTPRAKGLGRSAQRPSHARRYVRSSYPPSSPSYDWHSRLAPRDLDGLLLHATVYGSSTAYFTLLLLPPSQRRHSASLANTLYVM